MPSSRQKSFVPFESLASGRMLVGVPGNLQGDGVERQGLLGIEQYQDEIGHPLQSVESYGASHRGEPTAAAIP